MNKTVKKGSRMSSMRGPFFDIIFYGSLRPMAGTSSNRTDAGVPVLRAPLWSGQSGFGGTDGFRLDLGSLLTMLFMPFLQARENRRFLSCIVMADRL